MKQKVSVIIPTFNRCEMLKEAVESVLAQTFKDFELIVVDDGSYDNTFEMLKSYKDRLTYIRQENQGVSTARNTGIKNSRGDLIAFLDSDDLWLKDKLFVQTEFFDKNPDALICQTQEVWIKNNVRVNPKKYHKKLSGLIFEKSLELCLISPSAVMIRKELLSEVGLFDETLRACEDYDLWLRICNRYPAYLIDTPLIIKRGGHADQLSNARCLDKYRIKSLIKLIRDGGLSDKNKKAAEAVLKKKCCIYAKGCEKRGREKEADYYRSLAPKC